MEIKLRIPNHEKGLRTVHIIKRQIPQCNINVSNIEILDIELILF